MSSNKREVLNLLSAEFNRWEGILDELSEVQITNARLPNGWSIKDLMAHLMAWQQVTTARLQAAIANKAPALPDWLGGEDVDDKKVDHYNARIYRDYKDQPWSRVHQAWREGFLSVLEMGGHIPEEDLVAANQWPWLKGYPLIAVLQGTYVHHHEDHLNTVLAWRQEQSQLKGDAGHAADELRRDT